MRNSVVLKGNICYTPEKDNLVIRENAYVVCEEGICRGIFEQIPPKYSHLDAMDCTEKLILPGMTDLHIHAPQYTFYGTGMDYELLEWLDQIAFPEEIRYADQEYALKAYKYFAEKMKQSATTRAVIFGTIHTDATLLLMDCMEKSGLVSLAGKVNMDRNAPPGMMEDSAQHSASETRRFLQACFNRGYKRTKPILTPRFVPACSGELMEQLGEIRKEYDLPVQSHLSENPEEVELVRQLEPQAAFYGDAYDRYGLFGKEGNTVMAHCVYSAPEERERIKSNGVWIAHCPSSNLNLSSGIAPVRSYLDEGLRIGLGTDIGAGSSISMFRAITDAIQVSKLYWRYIDPEAKPLTFPEAFYLATKGGGSFFGKAGSFEDGYAFDAIVLDDTGDAPARPLRVRDRLERALYMELDRTDISIKFIEGQRVL